MITAYYTYCNELLSDYLFDALLYSLPESMQAYIRKFRFSDDQYRSMYGRLLLKQALCQHTNSAASIREFSIDHNKRPHLPTEPDFDFNISHSGDIVVCLVATNANRIGVDIEEKKRINLSDYSSLWRVEEVTYMNSDDRADYLDRFYQLWTQKEAVIKADGRGMSLPFNDIHINQATKTADVDKQKWQLHPLSIDERYTAHLASLNPVDSVMIEYVPATSFFECA